MAYLFTNNASGTLAVTLTVGATSAVLNSGEGALFPSPSSGDTFAATLEDTSGNIEVVSCTSRSSDTLTIVRAQEGTTALEFVSGSRLEIRLTAGVLNALLQSAAAAGLYAPQTHFNDNGTAAEQLNNSLRATITTNQGLGVQRATGQTATALTLNNASGAVEASLTTTSSDATLANKNTSGEVIVTGTNSSGSTVTLSSSDPDGAITNYYNNKISSRTADYGEDVVGSNTVAPYDAHMRIYNRGATVQLGAVGFIGTTNQFRIISLANGYPIVQLANNSGGTLTQLTSGNPEGEWSANYAGSKKVATTSTGAAITGVISQTGTPTSSSHLATKGYVDTAVADVTSPNSSLATNGYYTHPGGFTDQWGQVSVGANTYAQVTFPTAYSAVYSVVATIESALVNQTQNLTQVASIGNTTFRVYNGDESTRTFHWQAKGKV